MVSNVTGTSSIKVRLDQAASLPETLAAAFEAFEAIRMAARDCQDWAPELFAAFMTAADAAVDGQEALTLAPSLPQIADVGPSGAVAADTDLGQVADALAALAGMFSDGLGRAARSADVAGDRAACRDAAHAAGRIWQLMASE